MWGYLTTIKLKSQLTLNSFLMDSSVAPQLRLPTNTVELSPASAAGAGVAAPSLFFCFLGGGAAFSSSSSSCTYPSSPWCNAGSEARQPPAREPLHAVLVGLLPPRATGGRQVDGAGRQAATLQRGNSPVPQGRPARAASRLSPLHAPSPPPSAATQPPTNRPRPHLQPLRTPQLNKHQKRCLPACLPGVNI